MPWLASRCQASSEPRRERKYFGSLSRWRSRQKRTSSDGVSDRRPNSSQARWLQASLAAARAAGSMREASKAAQSMEREGSQRSFLARL